MSARLSIDTVKAEFDLWRGLKKSPQCRASDALRQKALALRAHYSGKEIVKALSLSRYRLASWDSAQPVKTPSLKNFPNPRFIQSSSSSPWMSPSNRCRQRNSVSLVNRSMAIAGNCKGVSVPSS